MAKAFTFICAALAIVCLVASFTGASHQFFGFVAYSALALAWWPEEEDKKKKKEDTL